MQIKTRSDDVPGNVESPDAGAGPQPLDDGAPFEAAVEEFADVGGCDTAIQDTFGVDKHVRPALARSQAP